MQFDFESLELYFSKNNFEPEIGKREKLGDQQLATLIRSAAKPADERQREIEGWVKKAAINQDPVSTNILESFIFKV